MLNTDHDKIQRAAYCDVDGTLAATHIVTPLIWFKRRQLGASERWLWLASLGLRAPWWLGLDCVNRSASNRAIYSSYAGLSCEKTKSLAKECFESYIWPRLFPQALERLAALRHSGHSLVLVTGGLDFLMRPLAEQLQAEALAPELEERDGVFTGALLNGPLAGRAKADAILRHSAAHNVNLQESCAFGDAFGDLEMLESVGHPVAVNPDCRLARIAAQRGWPREQWRQ
ncbi:MAG: HAD-IB family hydrolase [Planctomycetota bacterium]